MVEIPDVLIPLVPTPTFTYPIGEFAIEIITLDLDGICLVDVLPVPILIVVAPTDTIFAFEI
jgi:hypothetical protein